MKKYIGSLITIVFLIGSNLLLQHFYGGSYLDYALFIGLFTSMSIYLTNNKQGLMNWDSITQGQTGTKVNSGESEVDRRTPHRNKPLALITSNVYTIIVIVAMVIVY